LSLFDQIIGLRCEVLLLSERHRFRFFGHQRDTDGGGSGATQNIA